MTSIDVLLAIFPATGIGATAGALGPFAVVLLVTTLAVLLATQHHKEHQEPRPLESEPQEIALSQTSPEQRPPETPVLLAPRHEIAALWHLYEPPVTAAHPAILRPRQIAPLA